MTMLSRGSRPIGPIYNDANRASRRLERKGFGKAAEEMALLAEQQRLARGGSNITSAESNRDERDALEVAQSGLMRERADVAFRADAAEKGLTVEATGAQLTARKGLYERMRSGITPEMKAEAGKLGITDSGFAQASASASKVPLAPVAGVTAPTTLTRPSTTPSLGAKPVTSLAPAGYFTDKPFEFAAKDAAEPARRLEMRAAADKLQGTTGVTGNLAGLKERDAAERGEVMKSAMAASADGTTSRTRQDVVDAANKARVAAGKAPFDDTIYKDMSKLDVAKRGSALVEARNARVAEKVAGEIAAENTAAAPKRDLTAEEKAAADTYGITYTPSEPPPVGGTTAASSPEEREQARRDTAPVAPAAPAKTLSQGQMTQYDSKGRTGADLPAYYTPKKVPVYSGSSPSSDPVDPNSPLRLKRPYKRTF